MIRCCRTLLAPLVPLMRDSRLLSASVLPVLVPVLLEPLISDSRLPSASLLPVPLLPLTRDSRLLNESVLPVLELPSVPSVPSVPVSSVTCSAASMSAKFAFVTAVAADVGVVDEVGDADDDALVVRRRDRVRVELALDRRNARLYASDRVRYSHGFDRQLDGFQQPDGSSISWSRAAIQS